MLLLTNWVAETSDLARVTNETLAELGRQHFNNSLRGTITLTAGLGGMGGAQPLAVKMANGVFIGCDVEEKRIDKRIETGYLDIKVNTFEEALEQGVKGLVALAGIGPKKAESLIELAKL